MKRSNRPALGLSWDHWLVRKLMTASPAVGNLLASLCRFSGFATARELDGQPVHAGIVTHDHGAGDVGLNLADARK